MESVEKRRLQWSLVLWCALPHVSLVSLAMHSYHGEWQGGIVFTFTWTTQWSDLNELCILGNDRASKRLDFYRGHMIVDV